MPSRENDHIRDFLGYYYDLSAPGYAVLLTGPWGSGKTWFIRDFLGSSIPEGAPVFFVSLNGLQSIEAIDTALFRQLHPLLASKGARLLGSLVKGLLRATIKVDIESEGIGPDLSVSMNPQSTDGSRAITLPETALLVFDDIERCTVPLFELFGYINEFVEAGGLRTILIANEDELVKGKDTNGSESTPYRRIKEKLVGRTFAVQPEFETAIQHFASSLPSAEAQAVVMENTLLVKELYEASRYQNLRLIRHALWDFARLLPHIEPLVKESAPAMAELLAEFLVLSFEIRSGQVLEKELSKIRGPLLPNLSRQKSADDSEQRFADIRAKYPRALGAPTPVTNEVWIRIFSSGAIPASDLNTSLLRSRHVADALRPNWAKLWWGYHLSDEDFQALIAVVEEEWAARRFDDAGVVLHVAGMFLEYYAAGLCAKAPDETMAEAHCYITDLRTKGLLVDPARRHFDDLDYRGAGGLGFRSADDARFQELLAFVRQERSLEARDRVRAAAKLLPELLRTDPARFFTSLTLTNAGDSTYCQTPVLSDADPIVFASVLASLPFENRNIFGDTIRSRYQFSNLNVSLKPELAWLRELHRQLSTEAGNRKGRISGYTLDALVNSVIPEAIKRLESADQSVTEPIPETS